MKLIETVSGKVLQSGEVDFMVNSLANLVLLSFGELVVSVNLVDNTVILAGEVNGVDVSGKWDLYKDPSENAIFLTKKDKMINV